MKKSREKENSGNKMLLENVLLLHAKKLQSGIHYTFENKMVRLHDTNVWIWIAIIQHTEST